MDEDVCRKCKEFLEYKYIKKITRVIKKKLSAIDIELWEIIDFCPDVAERVLKQYDDMMDMFQIAINKVAQQIVYRLRQEEGRKEEEEEEEKEIKIRIHKFPAILKEAKGNISQLRSRDIGSFIQIHGTVIRTGMAKVLEVSRSFKCQNARCGEVFEVQADREQGYVIACPTECKNTGCKSRKFSEMKKGDKFVDYQEIKVQDHYQNIEVGSIPRSICIVLKDELVESCKAGDSVVCTGKLIRRWSPVFEDVKCSIEVVMEANQLVVRNSVHDSVSEVDEEMLQRFESFWEEHKDTPLKARDEIVKSFCPMIYGRKNVKLAVLLTMIGGVPKRDSSGITIRGQSHLLMIGDPGTGKSKLLQEATRISNRAILTTGIGTTSAGLTCCAVKDQGEWMLEAGALVLADGGICCVDEFSAMKEHDRVTIHEAMEQQTLSVAKAGMVCKLNSRTTVLAATNPKGKYDRSLDVTCNTSIASPLLSRFDLILLLTDDGDADWDESVTSFILSTEINNDPEGFQGFWTVDVLRHYIECVKIHLHPTLSPEAEHLLSNYYHLQRRRSNVLPITVRFLESLIRLAESHARFCFHSTVTCLDALSVILLLESSLVGCSEKLFPFADYMSTSDEGLDEMFSGWMEEMVDCLDI